MFDWMFDWVNRLPATARNVVYGLLFLYLLGGLAAPFIFMWNHR